MEVKAPESTAITEGRTLVADLAGTRDRWSKQEWVSTVVSFCFFNLFRI